jgi:hypothetical protein
MPISHPICTKVAPHLRAVPWARCYVPLNRAGRFCFRRKPNNYSDLYFSPVTQRNSVGVLAPVYSDAKGYQGNAGIRSACQGIKGVESHQ